MSNISKKNNFQIENSVNKILLVEDNLLNCEVALDMLETIGLDVDVVHDGQQALEYYDGNQYQLILMDCEMPIMDGYAATRHIRERERLLKNNAVLFASIPIIALTAHTLSSIKDDFKSCGMDDFLSKPFTLSDLKFILKKWLNNNEDEVSAKKPEQNSDTIHSPNLGDVKIDVNINRDVLNCEIINKFYQKQKKDGSNLVEKLITIYLEQSAGLLTQLTQESKNSNLESLKIIVHTLKSSSDNIGALALAELCRTVEVQCNKGFFDQELIKKIQQDYEQVKQALMTILSNINHL